MASSRSIKQFIICFIDMTSSSVLCSQRIIIGLLALFTGTVPTEAVSPGMTASAVGLVSGCAEIFGGGIAPAIAGFVAQHFGNAVTFPLMAAVTAAGMALLWLFLPETKPAKYDD